MCYCITWLTFLQLFCTNLFQPSTNILGKYIVSHTGTFLLIFPPIKETKQRKKNALLAQWRKSKQSQSFLRNPNPLTLKSPLARVVVSTNASKGYRCPLKCSLFIYTYANTKMDSLQSGQIYGKLRYNISRNKIKRKLPGGDVKKFTQ